MISENSPTIFYFLKFSEAPKNFKNLKHIKDCDLNLQNKVFRSLENFQKSKTYKRFRFKF